jgi:hypothetical protein
MSTRIGESTLSKTGNIVDVYYRLLRKRVSTKEKKTSVCFLQTGNRMAIFRLFDANENGKQMFVFLGWQTKNGNRLLLFQQTCLSTYGCILL